jgi:hypothetical protein
MLRNGTGGIMSKAMNAELEQLKSIEDPVKRRAYFTAILSNEIFTLTGKYPIVVGGEALEIYTQGSYTTGDIDLKSPKDALEKVLNQLGFTKEVKSWGHKDLDIYVEWVGSSLDEGEEAESRTCMIAIGDKKIRVVSIEDLIIDRLNASKYWNDEDSVMWAKVLLDIGDRIGGIDYDYLYRRSQQEDVADILREIATPNQGGASCGR